MNFTRNLQEQFKEPVQLPPMRIELEKELWQRNNYLARPMNPVKMESLRGYIDNLTPHNSIQPSTVTAWSQVHLANKPLMVHIDSQVTSET